MIRAGIQSGTLPATLLNLNHHLRLMGSTRRIIWETVSYPLLVAVLAFVVVSFFFVFLMPQFRDIFADFNTTLPGLTMLLIGIHTSYRGRANVVALVTIVLMLAMVFVLIVDLDRSQQGMLRASQQALIDLQRQLSVQP